MIDSKIALGPYTSKTMKQADEAMTLVYLNGQWDELNKAIIVFELMTKDTLLDTIPRLKEFYWAMRDRKDELHKLMEKKRKEKNHE